MITLTIPWWAFWLLFALLLFNTVLNTWLFILRRKIAKYEREGRPQ